MEKKKFTHIQGSKPEMVDVGNKVVSRRIARAASQVKLPEEIREHVVGNEIESLKGPVFQTAIIAGIQGAKKTAELIPLCHNLPLSKVHIDIELRDLEVHIICEARTTGQTGVEMEALTGASVAALTIYDMCKAFSHKIEIGNIKLIEKSGGKSDIKYA